MQIRLDLLHLWPSYGGLEHDTVSTGSGSTCEDTISTSNTIDLIGTPLVKSSIYLCMWCIYRSPYMIVMAVLSFLDHSKQN